MSGPYTMARDTQTKGLKGVGGWGSGRDGEDLGRSRTTSGWESETGQAAEGRRWGQEWEAKEWGEAHEAGHAQLTHSHHLRSHQAQGPPM